MLGKALEGGGGDGGWRTPASVVGMTMAVVASMAVIAGVALLVGSVVTDSGRPAVASARAGSARHQGLGPAVPLHVLTVSPSPGARRVSGDKTVAIAFSAPLAHGAAMPAVSPDVPGRWQIAGSTLRFIPAAPLAAATQFQVRIPAGKAGVRSVAGGLLRRPVTASFRTAAYSPLRLAEVLGELGYLPLTWVPNAGGRADGVALSGSVAAQEEQAYSPPGGSFSWNSGYPAALRQQWRNGAASQLVRGAVMAFQAQHKMAVNGLTGPRFWDALFLAAASGQRNAVGYTYAIASKGSPETLTIWHNGRRVLRGLANTGIGVAPTAAGTYPVYQRYRFQIMQGTNPDGSHYADPVSFVAYFNGGDAVHYFPRGSYGWPQSLGCVELPYGTAQRAWPFLTYGSLVTVTG